VILVEVSGRVRDDGGRRVRVHVVDAALALLDEHPLQLPPDPLGAMRRTGQKIRAAEIGPDVVVHEGGDVDVVAPPAPVESPPRARPLLDDHVSPPDVPHPAWRLGVPGGQGRKSRPAGTAASGIRADQSRRPGPSPLAVPAASAIYSVASHSMRREPMCPAPPRTVRPPTSFVQM
jgi:hypothetical protein